MNIYSSSTYQTFSGVSGHYLIKTMASNNDDFDNTMIDLNEITTCLTNTEEERQAIRQIEESLIQSVMEAKHSNQTIIQTQPNGPNPSDHNLIDPNHQVYQLPTDRSMSINQNMDSTQSISYPGPVSPLSLGIDNISLMSPPYVSPANIDPIDLIEAGPSGINTQRPQNEPLGGIYSVGLSVIQSQPNPSISAISQPIPIRGGLPYGERRRTDSDLLTGNILPHFPQVFSPTRPQNFVRMDSPFENINLISPSSGVEESINPQIGLSISEPDLRRPYIRRVPEYVSTHSRRGRPITRNRRTQPSAVQRREQLENEVTVLEVTNYELNNTCNCLEANIQYVRQRLREQGWDDSQLNETLRINPHMTTPYNPRGALN